MLKITKFPYNSVATLMFNANTQKLMNVLTRIANEALKLYHIESKISSSTDNTYIIDIDKPEPSQLQSILNFINELSPKATILGSTENPWIPRSLRDLDRVTQEIKELPFDHPGFRDIEYWEARESTQKLAESHGIQDLIPDFTYNTDDVDTWKLLFRTMTLHYEKVACREFVSSLREMKQENLIQEDSVPSVREISAFLQTKTGFQLKPVASITSARDFLSFLAFKVFPTSVHMRHHSNPHFTMDMDLTYSVLGHCPMLANEEFAQLIQEIGLASLGASENDLKSLLNLYNHTVEHGLKMSYHGELRILGARTLNSVGEIKHSLHGKPERLYFDINEVTSRKYIRRSLQATYWYFYDLKDAVHTVKRFADTLDRPYWITCLQDKTMEIGWKSN